ncbi:MAG: DUF502 domain-containing protein [Fuerstiella sp.]
MKQRIENSIGFFKATALGGVLFLLPLAVVAGLLGYVYSFAVVIYQPLEEHIPVKTGTGIAVLFVAGVALLLLLSFLAGLLASRAIGRRFAGFLEKYLSTLFPKYAIYRDVLAGNIGGTRDVPSLKPVLVETPESQRIAFEADRLNDGQVVVYFPGAPDTWIGHVGLVEQKRVQSLNVPFNDVVGMLEQLGRGSTTHLSAQQKLLK